MTLPLPLLKWPPLKLYRNDEPIESPVRQETLTRRYTEQAVRFIEKNRDTPFLLYLAYSMPHAPVSVSVEFRGASHHGRYGDAVQEIDWSAGQIIRALDSEGLSEDTLIFFTSDNGPAFSAKAPGGGAGILRGGKATTWEGGVRVPCLAQWPGRIPPRVVRRGITSVMDLFPTCVALAGGQVPGGRTIDGRNLMPTLEDNAGSPHSELYYYSGARLCAIRSQEWKLHLIKRELDQLGKPGAPVPCRPPELYNLERDPSESRNVSDQHPDIVRKLAAQAEQFQSSIHAGRLPRGAAIDNASVILVDGVPNPAPIPEPGTWLLASSGIAVLGLLRYRSKRRGTHI
jgi:arylsulfatase A-like enzyme